MQSRLLSAVLTGMNRAFPFAKLTDSTVLSKHIDALYRLTHVGGFGTSLQSLILLFQARPTADSLRSSAACDLLCVKARWWNGCRGSSAMRCGYRCARGA